MRACDPSAGSYELSVPAEVGKASGTYVLVLRLAEESYIAVGKLGEFRFPPGYHLYVGSAQGSGGLAARIGRHRRPRKRLHWHIDYLLQYARLEDVWYIESPRRLECVVAEAIRALPDARVPAPGFGSSDCRCTTHLFYFTEVRGLAMICTN